MTEHRRIAVPSELSLLERAAPGCGLAIPPVPSLPPAPRSEDRFAAAIETPGAPPRAASPPTPFAGERHPLDRDRLRGQGFIVPGDPVTGLLEEFRLVKRQLVLAAAQSRAGDGGSHRERILVASAHPGEGKTWVAVNLALAIAAEKDNEVLLVDADFAKPSVLSTLGLPGGPGLMDALADPAIAVEDCIVGTDVPGLYVLPSGQTTLSDTEWLASARTADVLDRLSAQAPNRLIIFDSPPALAASPAAELALHVGQLVVVVRAEHTGEAALKDALSLLSGCEDVKLLLNGTQFSPTGRSFGSYYGYGG